MTKVVKLSEESLNLMTANGLKEEQVALINSPTPSQWIKKRKGRGGKEFDYIPVGITIKVLNSVFGFNWSFEITKEEIISVAKQVLVKGKLKVRLQDGQEIIKEQFASKEIQMYSKDNPRAGEYISIGDDFKGAASLCLTKCASMFGLFSDIYSSEFYAKWEMPDGEDVITAEELKVDNSKAFDDIIKKIQDKPNKAELAGKMLESPPFELTQEQKDILQIMTYPSSI